MTVSAKIILVVFFSGILHLSSRAQLSPSALNFYAAGQAIKDKDGDKAFQMFEKAKNNAREAKEWDLYLKSVNALASLDLSASDDKAEMVFIWLKEAATFSKEFRNAEQLALLYYRLAKRYDLAYEIERPIEYYEKAKQLWVKLKGELSAEVAECYHGLGDVYKYNKFDFYEAEKCYEKALNIREKIQLKDVKTLYKNYYSLSATNRSQKDFEKALSYGTKTLELAENLSPTDFEKTCGMVANIYRDMGQTAHAKEFYFKALKLNTRTKDLSNRAWYYLSLGQTYKVDLLFDEALQYFEKAYQLYQRPEVKDQDLFINLLADLIESYSFLKNDKKFHNTISKLTTELRQLNREHSREAVQLWFIRAAHHARQHNYDSSLHYSQKALVTSSSGFQSLKVGDNPTEEQIGYRYYVSEILVIKAVALKAKFYASRNTSYLNDALKSLRLAETLVSKQRNTLDMEASKWEFLERNYDLYENILSCLFELSRHNATDSIAKLAFQYFEHSKSRSLADALAEKEQSAQISNNDSLFRVHAGLKQQLFTVQDAINNELNGSKDSTALEMLYKKIVSLDQGIQRSKLAIEQKYPGYFNVKYGKQTMSLSSVQALLAKKEKVLLEYFCGNETIYGLGISATAVIFKKIGSADSIKALVEKLRVHLSDERSNISADVFKAFIGNSFALHKLLISPFQTILQTSKKLLVIPDGPISQIPFEVLIEEVPSSKYVNYRSLRYLLQSFTVGYAYSSSMLTNVALGSRRTSPPSLLAVGFTDGRPLRSGSSGLDAIPGSEQELKLLEKHFNNGMFLTSHEASETNFKTLAPNYDILHLAIHGVGDVNRKYSAKLLFKKSNDEDDGELHAYELYGLKLKAIMTVLSSCESGVGKDYKGEGMISMASAFIFSGSENILMSLWKVNDQVSTTLMGNFYKHLFDGNSIDESLSKAKLNYIEAADELSADPKIWAPFIAYGSLDPVFPNDKNRSLFVVVGLVSIFLIIFFAYRRRER